VRHVELAQRLGVRRRRLACLQVADQHGAHALEDAEEAHPGPVRRHALHHQARAGHEHGGGDVEGGRGRVARDVQRVEEQLVLAGDRDAVAVALDAGAGAREQALRVVAAGLRLDDGRRALGQQAGEQHAALDLRGGDRQRVLGALQRAAGDLERREAAVARVELPAHGRERRRDPVDGPAADALVAVEDPAAPLLPGQPPGQQPQQRAGVADVDHDAGGRRPQARAAHDQLPAAAVVDQRAERLHGRERGARVGRVEVVGDVHRLRAHRAHQRRAVRERLVGRRHERAAQRRAGPEGLVHPRATGRSRGASSASASRPSPATQRTM
jgi:hypothetical protein